MRIEVLDFKGGSDNFKSFFCLQDFSAGLAGVESLGVPEMRDLGRRLTLPFLIVNSNC